MKKIVLIFGAIGGLIVAGHLSYSAIRCYNSPDLGPGSMVLGFTVMLLAFALNYVGIKQYRDKYNGGVISFGKAFLMSLYMCLIASTIYVVVWMIDLYTFMPDWMDRYISFTTKEAAKSGASAEELAAKIKEMEGWRSAYQTPWGVALLTYMEILPLGILVSPVIALLVKRKTPKPKEA